MYYLFFRGGRRNLIMKAEIIDQPYSGQYKERIYDISSPWNSGNWTWIKFENEDFNEWCGEFRGSPKGVALSKKYNNILVLTSDYLYQINCLSGELVEYESQSVYQNITVTPLGDFIIADYYCIEKIGSTLKEKKLLDIPIEIDGIHFKLWSENILTITCEEFLNTDKNVEMELDSETLEITIKDVI